jgi:CheY-like chemotaxis protein
VRGWTPWCEAHSHRRRRAERPGRHGYGPPGRRLFGADGRIALQFIDLTPDLIITDVMMPHLDGWALLDQAQQRNPSLPVILMSAGDWIRGRRPLPIPDHAVFLAKPFAVEELLELIGRLTGSRSS